MILNVQRKRKFLFTMIVIMACATMVNYGISALLDRYILEKTDIYSTVQWNIISVVIVIGVVTVIMIVLIPKETVSEFMNNISSSSSSKTMIVNNQELEEDIRTPEQQLQDMIDEELEEDIRKGK